MNYLRNDDLLVKLGARIKQLREEKGMSQDDVAKECEIERNQVYRIEKGKVNATISTLESVGKTLGVSLSDLFKGI